jgi:hypothetical protein
MLNYLIYNDLLDNNNELPNIPFMRLKEKYQNAYNGP